MDRGPEGNKRRSELAALQSDVQHTVADFTEERRRRRPSQHLRDARTDRRRGGGPKKPQSLKDINAEFQAQILTTKRERKKTTVEVDGHTVLKANNYSLEEGEQNVFAREVKQKDGTEEGARTSRRSRLRPQLHLPGVLETARHRLLRPLPGVRPPGIGLTQNEIAKATRWACPHHSCAECGRKAAAVGGMLFRCEACPRAFSPKITSRLCRDHRSVQAIPGARAATPRAGVFHPVRRRLHQVGKGEASGRRGRRG